MKKISLILLCLICTAVHAQTARVFGQIRNSKYPDDSLFTVYFQTFGRNTDSCKSGHGAHYSSSIRAGIYDIAILHKGRQPAIIRGVLLSGGDNALSFTLRMDTLLSIRSYMADIGNGYYSDKLEETVAVSTISEFKKTGIRGRTASAAAGSSHVSMRGSRSDAAFKHKSGDAVSDESSKDASAAEAPATDSRIKSGTKTADKSTVPASAIKAGQLTAGHWHDLSHWDAWLKTNDRPEIKQVQLGWNFYPDKMMRLHIRQNSGKPLAYTEVKLTDASGKSDMRAFTDQDGYVYFWPELRGLQMNNYTAASINGRTYENIRPYINSKNSLTVGGKLTEVKGLDIAFVVDATGSMGDEIRYLQAEMGDVIHAVRRRVSCLDVRTGSVFYRDRGDQYLCRVSELNSDNTVCAKFIGQQSAGGGGDFPEAVDAAMESALTKLKWGDDNRIRILFLILDAPPHNDSASMSRIRKYTLEAAEKGIRIVPVSASGINKATEFLMKNMAIISNGEYIYITNDSRIGSSHLAPTGGESKVKYLNKLMLQLILRYSKSAYCVSEQPDSSKNAEQIYMEDSIQILEQMQDSVLQQIRKNRELVSGNGWHMQFFPNPAAEYVRIICSSMPERLILTDMGGKTIYDLKDLQQETEIALSTLSAGVYQIQVHLHNEVLSGKLIVMH